MNTVKSLMLLLLCCIVVSCGKKEIVIKNSEGVKFTSYQEACSTSDFSSAHRYIDRMRAEYNSKGRRSQFSSLNIDEAEKYVFREEALYLMSQGTEMAQQRIIYLLKQYPSDSNCDMLVELAIEYDQVDFVKSLTRHYKSNMSSEILRKIVEYLYLEKGNENIDFVTTLLNRYKQENILLNAAIEKGDEALVYKMAQEINGDLSIDQYKKISDFIFSRGGTEKSYILKGLSSCVKDKKELVNYLIRNEFDEDFVIAQAELCKSLTKEELKNIVGYISSSNHGKKQKTFTLLASKVNDKDALIDIAVENKFNDFVCQYAEKTKTWDEAEEWIPILVKLKTEKSSNLILNFLTRIPVRGQKAKPGLCDFYAADLDATWRDEIRALKNYKDWVAEYNQECDKILSLAINEGNKYLARMVLSKYVDNVQATAGGDVYVDGVFVDGNHGYIKYAPTDRNAARKRYNEAINLGLLK